MFDEIGCSLAFSILDMYGGFHVSRLPASGFRSLTGVRDAAMAKRKKRRKPRGKRRNLHEGVFFHQGFRPRMSVYYRSCG